MDKALPDKILETAGSTGINLGSSEGALIWEGPYGGQTKPQGPLAG